MAMVMGMGIVWPGDPAVGVVGTVRFEFSQYITFNVEMARGSVVYGFTLSCNNVEYSMIWSCREL